MVDPHRVRLSEENGSFWHGNTLHMKSHMSDGYIDSRIYSFAYRRPFLGPHSVSLGAHGVVKVGIKPFSEVGRSAITMVDIIKSDDPISTRNFHYSNQVTPEDLLLATEVFDGDIGFLEVARLGVANALDMYSQREHTYIWAARRFVNGIIQPQD